jgi:flagellar biosynthesis/type III secretory pathway protein FliH
MPSSNKAKGRVVTDGGAVGRDLVQIFTADAPKAPVAFQFEDVRKKPAHPAGRTTAPAPERPIDPELERKKLEEAERRGYEKGLHEAQRAQVDFEGSVGRRFEGAVNALERALANAETAATKDAVRLAVMIAEKIVRRTLADDPEALAAAVADSAMHTEGTAPLKVVCDTQGAAKLRPQLDDLTRTLHLPKIEVEEDGRLATGDLMLYRGPTTLDARVQTRVQRIEQALWRELGLGFAERSADEARPEGL